MLYQFNEINWLELYYTDGDRDGDGDEDRIYVCVYTLYIYFKAA